MLLVATRPEIVEVGGSRRPRRPQNPSEKVGGEAPHLFRWFFSSGPISPHKSYPVKLML